MASCLFASLMQSRKGSLKVLFINNVSNDLWGKESKEKLVRWEINFRIGIIQ
jgi:hypothetical protein